MHPFETDEEPSARPPVPFPPIMRMQFHPIVASGTFVKTDQALNPGYTFDRTVGEAWDPGELAAMGVQSEQIACLPCTVVTPKRKGIK